MMATTHALVGLLLGAVLALVAPEHATTAMAAGLLGGLAPDLDLYVGHRRTLHFPVVGSAVAVPAAALALLAPTAVTLGFGAFAVAGAAHAAMDVFGGGLELRPWERNSEQAVYSHYHGRWLSPRRWIPYDGAPRDLALALAVGVPGVLVAERHLQWLLLTILGLSVGYTLLRRRLAKVAEGLVSQLPGAVRSYVPDRYRGGSSRATSTSRRR